MMLLVMMMKIMFIYAVAAAVNAIVTAFGDDYDDKTTLFAVGESVLMAIMTMITQKCL